MYLANPLTKGDHNSAIANGMLKHNIYIVYLFFSFSLQAHGTHQIPSVSAPRAPAAQRASPSPDHAHHQLQTGGEEDLGQDPGPGGLRLQDEAAGRQLHR